MYNQEINKFYFELIKQAENNLNEFFRTQTNTLACLKGFFSEIKTNKEELNKNALNTIEQGENMKFQGKTIFKNKKCNSWYTRVRIEGKQIYISGKTQKETLNKLKEYLKYKPKKKNTTTLYEWYLKWIELFKTGKVKETTIKDYNKTFKKIPEKIQNKNIKDIKSLEIIDILNNILEKRTKQKLYELLFSIFNKAKLHKIINENIIEIIEKPTYVKNIGIALSNKEQNNLINVCKNYIYGDLILITLYQGMRIGEVLALTGNDIDIINRKLNINKAINEDGILNTTKNFQSNRIIPIFNNAYKILKKYIDYKNRRLFDFTHSVPQKHIKIVSKLANIRDISMHDLRHTFITNCKNKEIPEHIIQSWVGHKIGSDVTRKIYTHINEEDSIIYLEKYNKTLED